MKKVLTFALRHSLGDCTNNGLTSRQDSIWLYSDVDINNPAIREELAAINEKNEILVLVKRGLFLGRQLPDIAVPFSILDSGRHSMAGGNFVYTSDSRFPSGSPISVHDRVE